MSPPWHRYKALTFDVGGTVFDWHGTIAPAVAAMLPGVDARAFANDWRRTMFRLLAEVRAGRLPRHNSDRLHRLALDHVLPRFPSAFLSERQKDELASAWHVLRAWPDAAAAIETLRSRYTVTVLTVLSWRSVVASSKAAGIGWDGILSCEFLPAYKPERAAYLAAPRLIGCAPHETVMVAAHADGDLEHAVRAGLAAAYVDRPSEYGETRAPALPERRYYMAEAVDFADLARQLTDPDYLKDA
ncbi:MAG: HAD-IA family hydrolase [Alphaproteobacteria bacterium]|nr:HAD-IA family hydrolase [Alphaproteobacteria bacterium]